MNAFEFGGLAERILRQATAPYHEHLVRAEAEKVCKENGLDSACDEFGNLHVRLQTDREQRPLVLAAHMDHPGFEVLRQVSGRDWLVRFRGGVGEQYFKPGLAILFMPGAVRGELVVRRQKKQPVFVAKAEQRSSERFRFAVWGMKEWQLRRNRIYARACDDLIGVSVVLATCIELRRARAAVNIVGVLSRAEEVGFQGALALAAASSSPKRHRSTRVMRRKFHGPLLPRDALLISLETSRELPGVKMGSGAIIRVGDRASIFDSAATRFLSEVAADLTKKGKIALQRALMSGGTCEATAYQEFGFECAAVCVALGNYHNCGPNLRIAPEYVDIGDACGLIALLSETARRMNDYEKLVGRLSTRLQKLLREGQKRLRREPEL